MMDSLVFGMTALRGTNKVGLIKPDEYGYRRVVLGALDAYNRSGDFYPFTEHVRKCFESSSSLMRKIQGQALRGEYEHPAYEAGMTKDEYLERIAYVDPKNISHHIRELELDFKNFKDDQGRPIIAVIGWVKPAGPKGFILKEAFENPHENVAFSVRSFSVNKPIGLGRLNRDIREIVTYDYVTEGGIKIADKFYSPSLESLKRFHSQEFPITASMIEKVKRRTQSYGTSMEAHYMNFDELLTSMGLERQTNPILQW